ncbi:MSHA biogenesis protein MshC [Rugamonas sp. CCM 8940]|nr:MSHA biogenesis protein MshC [Rugamonas sp. CCM 8940]MBJ7313586.1 MSHA biogenesis protein MshC [Rugamonas sp. CCM 8940]
MIELVVVLVVTGILGAVAVGRFFDNSVFEAREYADQVRAIIRYGQKVAVAQNRPIFVIADGNRFALCSAAVCTANNMLTSPAGSNSGSTTSRAQCQIGGNYIAGWMCEAPPAGTVVASNSVNQVGPNGYFYFDALGRPYAKADAANIGVNNPAGAPSTFGVVAGQAALQPLSISVTSGANNIVIVVQAETGNVF